jgi:hypothetical protein
VEKTETENASSERVIKGNKVRREKEKRICKERKKQEKVELKRNI